MSRSHDAKSAFVRERRPIRFPLIHTTVIATTRYAVSLVRPGKRPISRTASTRHFGRVDGFAQDSRSKLFLQQRLSRGSRSTLVGGMARIEVGVRQPPWQSRSARRIKTYHALLAVALLDLAIIAGAGAVALLTVRHFYPTLAISQYVLMWSVVGLGSLLFFTIGECYKSVSGDLCSRLPTLLGGLSLSVLLLVALTRSDMVGDNPYRPSSSVT